jgi:23S rRNA (guanine745-N1)-methyltransferase
MLRDAVRLLRCPACRAPLELRESALRCASGHAYDVARQGYVSLFAGSGARARGDSAAMVEARARFLGADHFEPLSSVLAGEARRWTTRGPVVDVGAGPGHHLARLLEALPDAQGLALDSSPAALKRAAAAHPALAAVGCDVWGPLPLRDDAAALALNVFAPRNGPELARVLAPDGALLTVTPTPAHLAELVAALGLLSVPSRKEERLDAQLAPALGPVARRDLEHGLRLSRADAAALVRMGPSEWHLSPGGLERRLAELAEPVDVTVSVTISTFAPAAAR